MKSSSQHTFAAVPQVKIPRSSFRRNCTYKTTFNAGYLVPIFLDEVLPGDSFNLKLTSFSRVLSALRYPIMDNLYMDFQFFFCPVRLVYDKYEEFFGSSAGKSGNWAFDDSHLMPGITSPSGGFAVGSLADYFGLPTGVAGYRVNCLPFRCYNRIISDWYQPSSYGLTSPVLNTGDSDDNVTDYPLVKRLKRADYFTSALPTPCRGAGAEIGLAGMADVVFNENTGLVNRRSSSAYDPVVKGDKVYYFAPSGTGDTNFPDLASENNSGNISRIVNHDASKSNSVTLAADLTGVSAISINDLRQAFQLQRALERDMRGGVRYVSQLLSHFGVVSPDARLQRTEYLGGGSVPINIHTVANTSGADGTTQGALTAFATTSQNKVGFVKSFVEHGYIIGLVSVRADLTYQQGIPRLFDRFARWDFYYPVFAHLGEQTIKNKEIYAQADSVIGTSGKPVNDEPFGYQERYAEYRFSVNKITGQLRSSYAQTLDAWHLAQSFNNLPTLSADFLEENVPLSRIKADTDAPDFLYDSLIELNCVRPMPLFGVPGLVDHG